MKTTHLNKNNAPSDEDDDDMKRLRLLIESSFVETRCKNNARKDDEPGLLGSFVFGKENPDIKDFIRYFSSERKEVNYNNLDFISYKQKSDENTVTYNSLDNLIILKLNTNPTREQEQEQIPSSLYYFLTVVVDDDNNNYIKNYMLQNFCMVCKF